jgi:hypothetical protein
MSCIGGSHDGRDGGTLGRSYTLDRPVKMVPRTLSCCDSTVGPFWVAKKGGNGGSRKEEEEEEAK